MKDVLACNLWLYKVFAFLRWWPNVNRGSLRDDALAGLTGAIIVLPQGVAFATIAGLPPEYGLYTAMVPAIIAALFGSSWHLVSGPTTAISIVVFGAISPLAEPGTGQYISLVLTLTFLVGLIQLIMGIARMGTLVNFISHTVVIGFTAGAAILIASTQIKNFFGVEIPRGSTFYETLHAFALQVGNINPYVTAVAILTLVTGILVKTYFKKIPYMIAAMVVGSLAALVLNNMLGVDVTGLATVGALPASLPPLSSPDFSLDTLKTLAPTAFAVTMLALTEAVSISRAIAVRSEQRIDGNQEFVGQGLANVIGSFFSSYASSGSFNRSGLNYEAGAKTPLAAVFASIALGLILLLVAPLAAYLPVAAMAAVLVLVAWGLIDFHHMGAIFKASRSETIVLATTFFATLFVELEFAIYVGVILSLVLYLNRTSRPAIRDMSPDLSNPKRRFEAANQSQECPQLKIVGIDGSVFFGAVSHVQQKLQEIDERRPEHTHLLILADGINFVDVAGAEMLVQEAKRRRRMGGGLYLANVKEGLCRMLRKGGYLADIGEENIFASKAEAIAAIHKKLNPERCETCTRRVFRECATDATPLDEGIDAGKVTPLKKQPS
ncbi:SulP family inorganic anion transporter [Thermithiobacillus plumbiphilus]|uniref:SulP family inorganic anion transporter n=1 Tax=Thermithiobacillus plumbiphilus TaxID=1729899 RepID=A0ABU9D6A0_9PROT